MFKFPTLLLTAILFLGCNTQKNTNMDSLGNTLTDNEKSSGWQLLFDGKSTDGWHTYGKSYAGKAWTIKDSALFLDAENKKNLPGGQGGDLVTNEEYGNFDLKLDWKIGPKGNSGIIFYIQEDTTKYPQTYNTGMEIQALDNGTPILPGHPDARLHTHRAGDLYDLLASKEVAKPQGEWNQMEIKSVDGKLDLYMNGEHTLSAKLWDDYWGKMIAISKFKDMPGFGTFKKGKISLQDHGEEVWFRNIRIKRL